MTTSTTFEERTGRRQIAGRPRGRGCYWAVDGSYGSVYRAMYRPTTTVGRVWHRVLHLLWSLLAVAITVTVLALFVAALVASWRWILSVLA